MSFVHNVEELIEAHGNGLTAKAPHWERVRLGDVAQVINGFPFPSGGFNNEAGEPVLRIRDIAAGSVGTFFRGDVEGAPRVQHGDLVVGMDGDFNSRLWAGETALINQRVCKIAPDEAVYSKSLLAYALPGYLKLVNDHTSAVTVKHLSSRTIADLPLPLPPRREQDRLASKLDELFSRIDEGERALEQVQKLVERYRQSVLKAAVTGELTRAWREKNKDKLESGEALLARILKARREAWEKAELAKMKAKGITPADDKWKQCYVEPSPPDTTDLPELPDGWTWCTGAQLFEWASGDFLPAKSMLPGNVPVYGGNGVNGQHSEANVDFSTIVVGRVGVHCGNVHISATRSWVTDNAIYATRLPALASLEYLLVCLRSAKLGKTSQGGAQPFVNQKALNEVLVPLPSVEEQIAAVDVLAMETSRLDSVLASVAAESRRMAALKQAVLKSAFSGALVAQDPVDEPASILLERIAAERSADAPAPKRGRKKKAAA